VDEPKPEILCDLHDRMIRIRHFEEEAGRLMETGAIPGSLHLYVGQEAVAAGVCAQLTDDDQITSTHRGHGHLVAKGGDLRLMFAELFGKATGYCKGKGGSMHICDFDRGMIGANAIVAGGIPIAVGAAFSNQYRGSRQVAAAFFGDGATNAGPFHESANIAALYQLPLVFVCENNLYGEFSPQHRQSNVADLADRAAAYGMPGVVVDGMDVAAIHEAAGEAIERARDGGGPTLLECKTYRFYDHVGVRGIAVPYRIDGELETWLARDPIPAFEARLAEEGVLSSSEAAERHAAVLAEIADAIQFARESPDPDPSALTEDVYA
jgi:TPP-dependent pyruvate/acetoin dehydrogenase alpha subunit